MEIKSDTPLRIKIGGLFVITGLLFVQAVFGPPSTADLFPSWLIWTMLIIIPVGYFLVLIRPAIKRKQDSEKINNMYLMTYGQKIPVDLSKCDVTENPSKTESVLIYKHSSDNKTEIFSTQSLPFDKNALSSKLRDKKQTFVYIDNKDRSKYFFDADFVHE
jgi:hypothetical protein